MTTTAADKAASNGSKSKQELTGIARVREADIWRIASVMHDAVYEAERLCNDIYRIVTDAYHNTSTAVATAASQEIRAKADEAYGCLQLAASYLDDLTRTDQRSS
jgi:hypothetical protein